MWVKDKPYIVAAQGTFAFERPPDDYMAWGSITWKPYVYGYDVRDFMPPEKYWKYIPSLPQNLKRFGVGYPYPDIWARDR
jgi:hypothetical protein